MMDNTADLEKNLDLVKNIDDLLKNSDIKNNIDDAQKNLAFKDNPDDLQKNLAMKDTLIRQQEEVILALRAELSKLKSELDKYRSVVDSLQPIIHHSSTAWTGSTSPRSPRIGERRKERACGISAEPQTEEVTRTRNEDLERHLKDDRYCRL